MLKKVQKIMWRIQISEKKIFSSKEAVRGKKYSLLNSISPLILT